MPPNPLCGAISPGTGYILSRRQRCGMVCPSSKYFAYPHTLIFGRESLGWYREPRASTFNVSQYTYLPTPVTLPFLQLVNHDVLAFSSTFPDWLATHTIADD